MLLLGKAIAATISPVGRHHSEILLSRDTAVTWSSVCIEQCYSKLAVCTRVIITISDYSSFKWLHLQWIIFMHHSSVLYPPSKCEKYTHNLPRVPNVDMTECRREYEPVNTIRSFI